MSLSAAHESKTLRKACQSCHARKARFRYRGHVCADHDHTLCFKCYRSERNRRRAQLLGDVPAARPLRSPFQSIERRSLTDKEVAHRRAMLACLAARGTLA